VRNEGIDAAKGGAIIAVVAIHALSTGVVGLDRWWLAGTGGVLCLSVPLFMAISAGLAAGDARPRPVHRRLVRLVLPYAAATAGYLVAGELATAVRPHRSDVDVVLFGGAWYHLYFLPALAQVLVLLGVVRLAARDARIAVAVAGGAAVVFVVAWARPSTDVWRIVDLRFALVWLPVSIVGAAVLSGRLRVARPELWLLAGLAILAVEGVLAARTDAPASAAYARAGVLPAVAGAVAYAMTHGAPRWLVALGRASLGVYLLHPAVLLVVAAARDYRPYAPIWVVPLTVVVAAVSWAGTEVLARTPLRAAVGRRAGGAGREVVEHNGVRIRIGEP
jgi:surface polysaccharide O-acyltransferase-like enzyme